MLFQGAASGHPSACTMHAEDVPTMIRRLETPPISLPASLVETIDVVCAITQAKVKGESVRRLREVVEIISVGEKIGELRTNTPFVWDPASDSFFFKTESYLFEKLVKRYGVSREYLQKEFMKRTQLLMELYRQNISDYKEVQDVIHAYYKTPEQVMKRFNIRV